METNDLVQFARRWSKMNAAHIEQRVAGWDGRYALLFVGLDEQTTRAVDFMCEYLQPEAVIRYDGQGQVQWREETEFLLRAPQQKELFGHTPSKVAIVTENLDRGGDWFHCKIKAICERAVVQVTLLATANDEKRIPDWLRSHYYIYHATQNLRKATDAYKQLPERRPMG